MLKRKRIFGMHRGWWIAAGLCFVAGLALIGSGVGDTLGMIGGILLLFLAMGMFAGAPMRYGEQAASKPPATTADPAPAAPPRPRPKIEAGDASEV